MKSVPRKLRSILLPTAISKISVYETVPSSRRKKLCMDGRLILSRVQVYWMKPKKTKKPSNQLCFPRSLIIDGRRQRYLSKLMSNQEDIATLVSFVIGSYEHFVFEKGSSLSKTSSVRPKQASASASRNHQLSVVANLGLGFPEEPKLIHLKKPNF